MAGVISKAEEWGLECPLPDSLTDAKINKMFFGKRSAADNGRKEPDYESVHRELAKSGVTLSLLWNEYREACRLSGEIPFMYTQFCKYYREWAGRTQATMHIHHKSGEKMEVDWAGTKMALKDNITGADIPIYIFVAVFRRAVSARRAGFTQVWMTFFLMSALE